MQYTIRDIPKEVDEALRAKARTEGKSLDEALLDAVARGLGVGVLDEPRPKRDLSFMGGMDDETLKAIQEVRAASDRVWPDEER